MWGILPKERAAKREAPIEMSVHDPSPFYSADNLATDLYDAITEFHIAGSSVEGDVEFYRAMAARTGGPILDVGCGTGRIASVLASDGFEVVGLDLSEPMLRVARRRRASLAAEVAARMTFVCADMTGFELDRTFALLLVPARAFQFLLTVEAQRSALASMRRHLAPGGELVLDLFDPRLDLCVPLTTSLPGQVDTVIHPTTGRNVRVERLERKNDPVVQVLTEIWRTTEVDEIG